MASTVGACLEALVGQSLPPDRREIIVVDNGSTDGTVDVVRRYPVTLVEEPAQGAPRARNRGVEVARGDLVAFTDADCVPSRGWLAHLVRAGNQPDVDVVAGSLAVLDPEASLMARYSATLGQYDPERTLAHPRFPYAVTGNLAIRRALLSDVGLFDPAFPTFDAAELFWRITRRGPLRSVIERRAVVFYRTRSSLGAFLRQNFGYGQGVGRYCRRVASADAGHAPSARALARTWGRRLGTARQLARSGGSVPMAAGLVGLHVLREVAIAGGTFAAAWESRP
jgi:glycosyltransferase involved in cell wall biosynthesis